MKMRRLETRIQELLGQYVGRWGIVIIDQRTGECFTLNQHMIFPAASMIKVPVMVTVFQQAAAGMLALDDKLTVTKESVVGGAGILQELLPSHSFTVLELVTLMIILSDNTATNLLINRVGMAAVNTAMTELGLQSTCLQRLMMDFAAAAAGQENYTTAADLAHLFQAITGNVPGSRLPGSDAMIAILKRQQVRDKLPFYLPEDTVLAHKTGTLPGVEHDGGIVYGSAGSCVVCVLTADLAVNHEGLQLVARIGKYVYDYFEENYHGL